METLESVSVEVLEKEATEKCPFKEGEEGVDSEEGEGIEDDDDDSVQSEQQNNGGTLGKNLSGGSAGAGGTVGGPFPPDDHLITSAPGDTARGRGSPQLLVPGTDDVEDDEYPFTVAAHHLIPGNAALGQSAIYDYLGPPGTGALKDEGAVRKRKKITVKFGGKSKTVEINKLIGYNVNGAHNGAWLPGNYAIRKYQPPNAKRKKGIPNTSPVGGPRGGKNWADLDPEFDDWKLHYVAAAAKVGKGQFHDTHEIYSDRVLGVLNKMALLLGSHILSQCNDCKNKKKLSPPFTIKERLYAMSQFLRGQLMGGYTRWKAPWFTSDHWGNVIFGSERTFTKFKEAWRASRVAKR